MTSRLLCIRVPREIRIVDKELSKLIERSVQELELSTRARNILERQSSIKTVGALASSTKKEMMQRWKNCGRVTVDEYADLLGKLGLSLGMTFVYPQSAPKNSSEESFPVDEWI